METLRVFALTEVRQAETRIYEGPRFEPWQNPYRHSLPPAPPKPKHKPKLSARARMSKEQLREVRQRLKAGERPCVIADAMNLDRQRVYSLDSKARCAVRKRERERDSAAVLATTAPTPPTAPAPTPARTHVLDWQLHMAAWQFEGQPKPRSKRKSNQKKCVSRADYRAVCPTIIMREGGQINPLHAGAGVHAINCAAARNESRLSHAEQAKNARKEAELAFLFAGGRRPEGDVEVQTPSR